ncbi:MAG: SRPBCC family protein [Deltaproteobacteria bacterium]|nr:SRPBCC family protein [Deltaproteobacteria bacterium]
MNNESLLRGSLRANAVFSAVSGVLALALAQRVGALLALPAVVVSVTGGALVVFALSLGALSLRARVSSPWSVLATALDVGWVVLSAVLLAVHSVPSVALVLGLAAVVAVFALAQVEGHRRALFVSGRGVYALSRTVAASPERAWRVVSDVAGYAQVAATLHRSEIVSGSGLGMVRKCEDTQGVCWTETCTRWEEGAAYAFEVDTRAPGYPLPLASMRGDFEVAPGAGGGAVVRVAFGFEPKGGWGTAALLGLVFAARGDAQVGAIMAKWAAQAEAG